MKVRDIEGLPKPHEPLFNVNKKHNSFELISAFRNDFNFNRTLTVLIRTSSFVPRTLNDSRATVRNSPNS